MSEPDVKIAVSKSPFWQFSIKFYAVPGVAEACIELQDQAKVDVNILFFLLWNATQGRAYGADVTEIERRIGPWRDMAVVPIRNIRRALKSPPPVMAPDAAEGFRTRIKAVELEAERLQQEALYGLAQTSRLGRPSAPRPRRRGPASAPIRASSARSRRSRSTPCFRHLQSSKRPLGIAANKRDRPMTTKTPRRLVIGISGASGTIYGVRMLEMLKKTDIETHLVMSKSAEMTLVYETKFKPKDVRALASVNHPAADIGASISSGSFATMGMIVVPCSIRTMSEIATGVTSSLVSRAADVVLKEKRRLVLAVRETPLHVGHLRTLTTLAEIGAVVAPIVPAFYNKPKTVDDIINHTVGRLLDFFGIETKLVKRWEGGPAED